MQKNMHLILYIYTMYVSLIDYSVRFFIVLVCCDIKICGKNYYISMVPTFFIS